MVRLRDPGSDDLPSGEVPYDENSAPFLSRLNGGAFGLSSGRGGVGSPASTNRSLVAPSSSGSHMDAPHTVFRSWPANCQLPTRSCPSPFYAKIAIYLQRFQLTSRDHIGDKIGCYEASTVSRHFFVGGELMAIESSG